VSVASPPERARIDAELVRRGLARSRAQAAELIKSGRVRLDGDPVTKPSYQVDPHSGVDVERRPEDFDVGRGAGKLRGALEDLTPGPHVRGRRCIDVGASTGGFTQVLLERGAQSVLALDVGHDQLASAVASDPRVEERSGTNVRTVTAAELNGPFDLLVADLSFISLTMVMAELAALVRPGGDLLLLVKPQFEIGRERLANTGIVRSEQQRQEALDAVRGAAAGAGLTVHEAVPSRVFGGTGNVEYFLWAGR
jgi:23S rRNA (cytidine1920-2'-O)/16S rRNA (cytidine1409-2'-O)-methyltransferase